MSTMTAPAPDRLTQRLDALEAANEIRTARAVLRRDLKAGNESIVAVLEDPPAWCETAHVIDLLLAVPKFGQVKVHRVLSQCCVSSRKTIGGLSDRQRADLIALLGGGPGAVARRAHEVDRARLSAVELAESLNVNVPRAVRR
jgi:hypothetical protein